ncbi:hypothetical protein KKH24_00805 [Patescibacteria group bacterium]|nr:hypothetical protein [Patescibacteria group bacterium]
MTKQTQIIFAVSIIVALALGWTAGAWYGAHRAERQVDRALEEFQDYMDEFTTANGMYDDDDDFIDLSDLGDLSHDILNNMPVPYNDIFCDYDGQSILAGDTYYDGCNWCSCQDDGAMLCTERACESAQ